MAINEILARLLRYVALAFVTSTAFAGTIDPNTPDSKYVEFGKKFPCVVRIRADQYHQKEDKTIRVRQWGSAVIVRPNWVLTAAHIAAGVQDHYAVKDDDTEFPLTKVFVHQDFKEEHLGHYDIALGYSPKDFDLEFYCPLYTDKDEVGKAVTIAGYGIHGTFLTGARIADEKKRAGHNRIDSIERSVLICRADSGRNRFPLEFIITPGDSGGGLFIGNKLAGINSFLMAVDGKPDGTYTDEAAHIRVSAYADWVNDIVNKYEAALTQPQSAEEMPK